MPITDKQQLSRLNKELKHIRVVAHKSKSGYVNQIRYKTEGKEVRRVIPAHEDTTTYCLLEDKKHSVGIVEKPRGVKSPTLNDVIHLYFTELQRQKFCQQVEDKYTKGIRPKTYKRFTREVKRHILPHIGHLPIDEIKPKHICMLQDKLKVQMVPQSVNAVVKHLSRIFRFLVRHQSDYLEHDPCWAVESLRTIDTKVKYTPTRAEVEAVLKAADKLQHKVMLRLAAETGLRISEILGLRWECIEGDQLKVNLSVVDSLPGKVKSRAALRKIKLSSKLKILLAEYKLQSTKSFLFVTRTGRLTSSANFRRSVLEKACKNAGVQDFGWHGFRRFYQYELKEQGARKDHIQALMGHAKGSKVTDKHYDVVREKDVLIDDYVIEIASTQ